MDSKEAVVKELTPQRILDLLTLFRYFVQKQGQIG